ncbi:hypothetical protein [Glycomyces sp. NRRL B-16210]|uniref:hypothetical protein n=1 Tax=Glycomyces sp. NRRL B-16210 TaxID=1463821 RepID=UPI0004BF07F9|nr:hypothetical protein [Glycomyces sp. NRRL B-16210]
MSSSEPDADLPPETNRSRLAVRVLIAIGLVVVAVSATVIVLVGRGDPIGETRDGADPAAPAEATATATAEALPEDYACFAYDVTGFEAFAGGAVNDGYALEDAYWSYLDLYGTGMIHCEFLVGDPDDGVEAGVTVWAEPDAAAAAESLAWERGNWESAGDGAVEDYAGPAGEGFLYTAADRDAYLYLCVLDGTTIVSADLSRTPEGRTPEEAAAVLLDLAEQGIGVYAEHPPEGTDIE